MEQLEEVWIEDLENATDNKVQEECIPGKPISLFTTSSLKVSYNKLVYAKLIYVYLCELVFSHYAK